ncbi:MAG: HEAT repeat domain-containing protein [Gemmatimonadetes bacterium]|nr:HEAT repeat domain-containing protein [Gemmatimonadota bacterium]
MYKLTRNGMVPGRLRYSRGFVHVPRVVGLVLAALLAADSGLMIGGALDGPGYKRLAAQDGVSRQEEERLFLEARHAVNQEEFERAADLFATLRNVHASTRFDADSYYWEAFARFRLGDLPEALLLLETLTAGYEGVAGEDNYGNQGRLHDEVQDLHLRIRRQQGESGDPEAAAEVLRESRELLRRAWADSTQRARTSLIATRQAQARMDSIMRGRLGLVEAQQARADSVRRTQAESVAAQLARADSVGRVAEATVASAQARSAAVQRVATAAVTIATQAGSAASRRESFGLTSVESGLLYSRNRHREGCENESVQQSALTALLRLETERMGPVRSVLERVDECSVNLRRQAVNWLARQSTEEAEQELIKAATSNSSSEVRKAAIFGLRRFVTEGSFRTLSGFARQSDDEDLRSAAVVALGRNRREDSGTVLWQLFRDMGLPEEFRAEVFTALGRRTDVPTESLTSSYGRVGSEDLKVGVLETLGRRAGTGEEEVTNWLFDRALDQEESVKIRQAAMNAWAWGPMNDLSRLSESYESLEPRLRERVFFALHRRSRSRDAEQVALAIDKMIELARRETDPRVRQQAIDWIGSTESERAVEFLREQLGGARPDTVPKPGTPETRR